MNGQNHNNSDPQQNSGPLSRPSKQASNYKAMLAKILEQKQARAELERLRKQQAKQQIDKLRKQQEDQALFSVMDGNKQTILIQSQSQQQENSQSQSIVPQKPQPQKKQLSRQDKKYAKAMKKLQKQRHRGQDREITKIYDQQSQQDFQPRRRKAIKVEDKDQYVQRRQKKSREHSQQQLLAIISNLQRQLSQKESNKQLDFSAKCNTCQIALKSLLTGQKPSGANYVWISTNKGQGGKAGSKRYGLIPCKTRCLPAIMTIICQSVRQLVLKYKQAPTAQLAYQLARIPLHYGVKNVDIDQLIQGKPQTIVYQLKNGRLFIRLMFLRGESQRLNAFNASGMSKQHIVYDQQRGVWASPQGYQADNDLQWRGQCSALFSRKTIKTFLQLFLKGLKGKFALSTDFDVKPQSSRLKITAEDF